MNLSIYQKDVLQKYKSNSQRARVLTENWFSAEMYCPCCLSPSVQKLPNNSHTLDFICERCRSRHELKSSSKKFGKYVNDGEYQTMIQTIIQNRTPNFFMLNYSKDEWLVKNLFMIPNHFFSRSIIEKRSPLSINARRAGWIGCHIMLDRIPENGRINLIQNEKIIDQSSVHKAWRKMLFLSHKNLKIRGWTSDVLKCIEDLDKKDFTLKDIYNFKEYLSELHPENNYVEEKIRQQLQILRDNNVLKFSSPGKYQFK